MDPVRGHLINFQGDLSNLGSHHQSLIWRVAEWYLDIREKTYHVKVVQDNHFILEEKDRQENWLITAIKVISHFAIILPVIAICIRYYYRSGCTYTYEKKASESETVSRSLPVGPQDNPPIKFDIIKIMNLNIQIGGVVRPLVCAAEDLDTEEGREQLKINVQSSYIPAYVDLYDQYQELVYGHVSSSDAESRLLTQTESVFKDCRERLLNMLVLLFDDGNYPPYPFFAPENTREEVERMRQRLFESKSFQETPTSVLQSGTMEELGMDWNERLVEIQLDEDRLKTIEDALQDMNRCINEFSQLVHAEAVDVSNKQLCRLVSAKLPPLVKAIDAMAVRVADKLKEVYPNKEQPPRFFAIFPGNKALQLLKKKWEAALLVVA